MAERRLDVSALYAALDQKRQVEDISWRELARRARVSPSTLTRMGSSPPKRPDVDSFGALIAWLGVPAERFLTDDDGASGEVDTMAMISTHLRADKDLSPETAAALEDILRGAYKRLRQLDDSEARLQD